MDDAGVLSIINNVVGGGQPSTAALPAVLSQAVQSGTSPDQEAEWQRLARESNVPVGLIRNGAPVKLMQLQQQAADLPSTNPVTARTLMDPDNAAVAHDDIGTLTRLEDLARNGFGGQGTAPVSTLRFGTPRDQAEANYFGREYGTKPFQALQGGTGKLVTKLAFPVAGAVDAVNGDDDYKEFASQLYDAFDAIQKQSAADPSQGFGGKLFRSLEELAPMVLSGGAGLGNIVGQAVNGKYDDLTARGVDPDTATALALKAGMSAYAMTKLPFGGTSLANSLVRGAVFNPAYGVLDRALDKAGLNYVGYGNQADAINLADPEEIAHDMALGLVFGAQHAMETGRPIVGNSILETLLPFYDTMKAGSRADALQAIGDTVQASRLNARDLDLLQQHLQAVGDENGIDQVYVPVNRWNTLFQDAGMDPAAVANEMLSNPESYHEANTTGADIPIPYGEYTGRLSGLKDVYPELVKDTRLGIGDATLREAEEAKQALANQTGQGAGLLDALKGVFGKSLEEVTKNDSSARVYDDVLNQQMETGIERSQADTNARLMANVFRVLGERAGVDPFELYKEYNLKLTGPDRQGDVPPGTMFQSASNDLGGNGAMEPHQYGSTLSPEELLRQYGTNEQSCFGPVWRDLAHNDKGAIERLRQHRTGEAIGALRHPDIGDIDLVWGKEGTGKSDGYGLAKILKYHPEVTKNLQDLLSDMKLVYKSENRAILESEKNKATVRLEWDGQAKQWLLTAFQKRTGDKTTTDTLAITGKDDTASPPTDSSLDSIINSKPSGVNTLLQSAVNHLAADDVKELYQSAKPFVSEITGKDAPWAKLKAPRLPGSEARGAEPSRGDESSTHDQGIPNTDDQVKVVGDASGFNDKNILNKGAENAGIDLPDDKDELLAILKGLLFPGAAAGGAEPADKDIASFISRAGQHTDEHGNTANVNKETSASSIPVTGNDHVKKVVTGALHSAITRIKTTADAAHIAFPLAKRAQEAAIAIVTDAKGNVLGIIQHSTGSLESTSMTPRDLLGVVHDFPGAAEVWFAHNHPSGDPSLSPADREVTSHLAALLDGSGIKSRGQIVVGQSGGAVWTEGKGGKNERIPLSALNLDKDRNKKIKTYDREIIKLPSSAPLFFKKQTVDYARSLGVGASGVIVMDTKIRPVAFVPMSVDDMARLKTGDSATGSSMIMSAFHKANGAGMILVAPAFPDSHAAVRNMASFNKMFGGILYDIVETKSGRSFREDGSIPAGSGLFYQGGNGKRGFIRFDNNRNFEIGRLKDADLSTFIHESGHFFTEVLGDLAERPDAPRQIKDDYATLLKFAGVDSRDAIQAEHHEKLARAFEAYIKDGSAPSVETHGMFQRMKAWMISVYKDMTSLDIPLNPEVRDVFDRMLATDGEIERMRDMEEMKPLFATAEDAGMSRAEFQQYREDAEQAGELAKEQLLRKLMAEKARERKQWWRDERNKIRTEVEAEAKDDPIYQAYRVLTTGKTFDGREMGDIKLSRSDLVKRYGEDYVKKLPKEFQRVYAKEGGLHPDAVAEMAGFGSGDEMVRKMASVPKLKDYVKAETDRRMGARHGDMMQDGSIQEQARQDVHNDAQGRVVRAELLAIRRMAGEERPFVAAAKQEGKEGSEAAARWHGAAGRTRGDRNLAYGDAMLGAIPPVEFFRKTAIETMGAKRVADIQPHLYAHAARSAARESFEAVAKGYYNKAAEAKYRELLNHCLYKEAAKARDYVDKVRAYATRMGTMKEPGKFGQDGGQFHDQIRAIVDRYGFDMGSDMEAGEREPLEAFLSRMKDEEGVELPIPEVISQGTQRTSYLDLSMDELRAVHDSMLMLAHGARQINQVNGKGRKVEVTQAALSLSDRLFSSIKGAVDLERKSDGATSLLDRVKDLNLELPVLLPEFMFEHFDGWEKSGPWHEFIWDRYNDAADHQARLREMLFPGIMGYAHANAIDRSMGKIHIDSINADLVKDDIIAIALNCGNPSNLDKLMRGGLRLKGDEAPLGLDHGAMREILSHLSAQEIDVVNGIWKTIDTIRPEAAEQARKRTGVEPNWIEKMSMPIKNGILEGGYYPVKYDPRYTAAGEKQADPSALDQMFNKYVGSSTGLGNMKERSLFAAPVSLDWQSMVSRHLDELITEISHWQFAADSQRLLKRPEVRDAVNERLGAAYYKNLLDWVRYTVNQDNVSTEASDDIEKFRRQIRSNMSAHALAFKVANAVKQKAQAWLSEQHPTESGWMSQLLREPSNNSLGASFEQAQELNGKIAEMAQLQAELAAESETVPEARNGLSGEPSFTRGKIPEGISLTTEELAQLYDDTLKDAKHKPPVVIKRTVSELPFDAPGNAKASWWNGRVYIVAGNLRSAADGRFAIAREVIGHFGLRGFFGPGLDDALNAIHKFNPQIQQRAAEWIKHNQEMIDDQGFSKEDVHYRSIEEGMAEMAEEGKTFNLALRLVRILQKSLRKIGFDDWANWLEAKSDAEAIEMLHKAEMFVKRYDTKIKPFSDDAVKKSVEPVFCQSNDSNICHQGENVRIASVFKGIMQYMRNPIEATRFTTQASDYMMDMDKSFDRDIAQALHPLSGPHGVGDDIKQWAMAARTLCQKIGAVMAWHAGYIDAQEQGLQGNAAVRNADAGCRISQVADRGGDSSAALCDTYTKELARFIDPSPAQYYDNQPALMDRGLDFPATPGLITLLAGYVANAIIFDLMRVRHSGDPEKPPAWIMARLTLGLFDGFPAMLDIAGDDGNGIRGEKGKESRLSPVQQWGKDAVDGFTRTINAVARNADWHQAANRDAKAIGGATGAPALAGSNVGRYIYDVLSGNCKPDHPWSPWPTFSTAVNQIREGR